MSSINHKPSLLNVILHKIFSWFFRLYGWLTQRLYHEFAWAYDLVSWGVSLGQWDAMRRIALDYIVGERVLEIGFGTGELLPEMLKRGYRVTGLDSSIQMHRVTRHKLFRQNIDVMLVRAETQVMPFAERSFDSIISTFPAGYIHDPKTWHEFKRVIGNRGRIIVSGTVIWRTGRKPLPDNRGASWEALRQPLLRCEELATQAGLKIEIDYRQHKGWTVPVIIAKLGSPSSRTSQPAADCGFRHTRGEGINYH